MDDDTPIFAMSMFANKADLYKAKAEYLEKLLQLALNEYASKNALNDVPENHWSRKVLDLIT